MIGKRVALAALSALALSFAPLCAEEAVGDLLLRMSSRAKQRSIPNLSFDAAADGAVLRFEEFWKSGTFVLKNQLRSHHVSWSDPDLTERRWKKAKGSDKKFGHLRATAGHDVDFAHDWGKKADVYRFISRDSGREASSLSASGGKACGAPHGILSGLLFTAGGELRYKPISGETRVLAKNPAGRACLLAAADSYTGYAFAIWFLSGKDAPRYFIGKITEDGLASSKPLPLPKKVPTIGIFPTPEGTGVDAYLHVPRKGLFLRRVGLDGKIGTQRRILDLTEDTPAYALARKGKKTFVVIGESESKAAELYKRAPDHRLVVLGKARIVRADCTRTACFAAYARRTEVRLLRL